MTIHIFGDSFACICEDDTDKCCWPHHLSKLKKESIRCFATAGSGPNDALTKLIFELEGKRIHDHDTVFVCLSDQKRLNFSFLKNRHDSGAGIFQIAEDDYENARFMESVAWNKEEDWEDVLTHDKEIKTLAQSLGPMFLYENVKNITFLHLIANNFKNIRFVVFTCFSLEHYLRHYKNFNIKSTKLLNSLTFDSLDTVNFDYVKIPIGHIVGQDKMLEESLINHMTQEQNTKFAQLVYDVIMYKEIDKSWFVKDDPYDDPNESSREMEPLFIYE